MNPRNMKAIGAATVLLTACSVVAAIIPDHHDRYLRNGEKTVLVWYGTGSLKVTKPCTVEVLLVGGGGGGGDYNPSIGDSNFTMGGGGAGGFLYKESYRLDVGDYAISVGAGGAVGLNGGDTTAFGLTAYGGGNGGCFLRQPRAAGNGGSGGGATMNWNQSGVILGGTAKDPSQGNNGGSTSSQYGGAGGGGAGAPGVDQVGNGGSAGGDGRPCSITGKEVWYAGGGGGSRYASGIHGAGGNGGGGAGTKAGTDGLGGGGGAYAKGGSGVAILSFVPEAEEDTEDFALTGGEVVPVLGAMESLHVFKTDDVLTVVGTGTVDILMVGGGGGGGPSYTQPDDGQIVGGGGGGAGGFVYFTNVTIAAGTYDIKVGQGGALGANGGDSRIDSTQFPVIAHGGGAGAGAKMAVAPTTPGNGGSGGGATDNGAVPHVDRAGGLAAYLDEGVLGNNGGMGKNYWAPGGGGGAGAPGADSNVNASPSLPGVGGTGLPCRITGEEIWYAGGGAGYRPNAATVAGGKGGGGASNTAGTDGLGGGGGGGAVGGSGIVIVRCRKPIPAERKFRDATGGRITTRGGYRIHTFTDDGEFAIPHNGYVEVLVVGGGGGGGDVASQHASDDSRTAGGGGAGGFVYRSEMIVTGGVYRITVGKGGEVGMNGGDSKAFDIIAYGGGNGGWFQRYKPAGTGGSGGGAVMSYTESQKQPLVPSAGGGTVAVTPEQGHAGGSSSAIYNGAGGGGAGAAAPDADPGVGCTSGGDGLPCSISGEEVWYAGGGAGYRMYKDSLHGGAGGGGAGNTPGTDGLGGGGGGFAKGGNGVVIIRYQKTEIGMTLLVR